MALKAIVKGGRLLLDEPTDLPDGTELELVVDDESGSLDSEELARLDAALGRAATSLDAGQWVDGDDLLARLHARSS